MYPSHPLLLLFLHVRVSKMDQECFLRKQQYIKNGEQGGERVESLAGQISPGGMQVQKLEVWLKCNLLNWKKTYIIFGKNSKKGNNKKSSPVSVE